METAIAKPLQDNDGETTVASLTPVLIVCDLATDMGAGHLGLYSASHIRSETPFSLLASIIVGTTKLNTGDVIGVRCNGKKYRFRVVWIGKQGTPEAGNVGLQSLESGAWIWDDLRLPLNDFDVYTRPPESERRLINRAKCFVSAEVVCDGTRVLAFVRDLSLGGCYIGSAFPFPLEAKLGIALWLDEQIKIWTDGIVVSRHAGIGMGINFLGLTRPNLKALEHFMKELSPEESPIRIWLPSGHRYSQ